VLAVFLAPATCFHMVCHLIAQACRCQWPAHGCAHLQAALLAMDRGRDFVLRVRPTASSRLSGSSTMGRGGSSSREAQQALTILFRPAEGEQLRAAMPSVGIPAWVGGSHHPEQRANGTTSAMAAGQQPSPSYYFGGYNPGGRGGRALGGKKAPRPLSSAHRELSVLKACSSDLQIPAGQLKGCHLSVPHP